MREWRVLAVESEVVLHSQQVSSWKHQLASYNVLLQAPNVTCLFDVLALTGS
jgi:hypothetical protein